MSEVAPKRPLIDERTPIGKIPVMWLRFIEKWVHRGPSFHSCWIWTGFQKKGVPYIQTRNASTGKCSQVPAQKLAASIFFVFTTLHQVITTCGRGDCVNPSHLSFRLRPRAPKLPRLIIVGSGHSSVGYLARTRKERRGRFSAEIYKLTIPGPDGNFRERRRVAITTGHETRVAAYRVAKEQAAILAAQDF